MNKIIIICAMFFAVPAWTNENDHEHEHETNAAEIKLSVEAIRNYGIKTIKPAKSKKQTLPRTALVVAKNEYFIYAKDNEHFMEIKIIPLKITGKSVTFQDTDYEADKEYVVSGAKYLRIIFLNNRNPQKRHAH